MLLAACQALLCIIRTRCWLRARPSFSPHQLRLPLLHGRRPGCSASAQLHMHARSQQHVCTRSQHTHPCTHIHARSQCTHPCTHIHACSQCTHICAHACAWPVHTTLLAASTHMPVHGQCTQPCLRPAHTSLCGASAHKPACGQHTHACASYASQHPQGAPQLSIMASMHPSSITASMWASPSKTCTRAVALLEHRASLAKIVGPGLGSCVSRWLVQVACTGDWRSFVCRQPKKGHSATLPPRLLPTTKAPTKGSACSIEGAQGRAAQQEG